MIERLRQLLGIDDLRRTIARHTETMARLIAREREPQTVSVDVTLAADTDEAKDRKEGLAVQRSLRDYTKYAFIAAATYATLAGVQTYEMKQSTDIAACTYWRGDMSFRADERAWLTIETPTLIRQIPPTGNIGTGFHFALFPRNVGKTAAHDIVIKARSAMNGIELGSDAGSIARMQDLYLKDKFTEMGTGKPVVVPQNPVPRVLAPNSSPSVPFTLDAQEPQIFPKGEYVRYLIGRMDYTDQFDIKHWHKFCFFVANAHGDLWNCEAGNDDDDNRETTPSPNSSCH